MKDNNKIAIICTLFVAIIAATIYKKTDFFGNTHNISPTSLDIYRYPANIIQPISKNNDDNNKNKSKPEGPTPYLPPINNPDPYFDKKNNSYNNFNDMIPHMELNSSLSVQPLLYKYQIYPKTPWYPKSGMKCFDDGCGATGYCDKGYCARNPTTGTVFDGEVQYKFN